MLLVRNLVTGTGKVDSTTLLDRRIGRIEELDGLLKVALALAKQELRLRVGDQRQKRHLQRQKEHQGSQARRHRVKLQTR